MIHQIKVRGTRRSLARILLDEVPRTFFTQ